ncbi:Carboxypeptidase regulatory-like domain-containing protein [Rubrivivax sp. A210]|uniref:PASTA domain-containing protein n=1 Tax=Rubrivivax sp. A210 TaxID=2772301 RepID=UPI001919B83E|nr:PASTA domain-containing protein [Rubrivivax sp. A210]CAD5366024.1 Carboxypeptidase regulatory-like domain-containing protein [Rubrivivax sp. A210]
MIFDPPFIKKLVNPGEPLTAQAWNDVVNALGQVHTFLENTEATALKVQISAAGADLAQVRVSALRSDGIAFDAVPPLPPSTQHMFPGLRPGSYTLQVSATGFQPATLNVTVPEAGVQAVALSPSGAFMPSVFGLTLAEALAALANLQISVARVLDITGSDVPVANPGSQFADARVLMQLPLSGTAVPVGQQVQLVVSATIAAQATVEIPPLAGLTLAEAQKALDGMGLVLGKVVTKQTRVAL